MKGAQIPEARSSEASKFCTVVPNIGKNSAWNLPYVNPWHLARNLRSLLDFCKTCGPLHNIIRP